MNLYVEPNGKVVIEQTTVEELQSLYDAMLAIIDTAKIKNILPRPVIRDGNGKFTKDYSTRDWLLKLQEEIFEVISAYDKAFEMANMLDEDIDEPDNGHLNKTAEGIADIITVWISWLESLGYDEKKRSELFAKVNEKNKKRGYFRETD